jgi:hypothetical protein
MEDKNLPMNWWNFCKYFRYPVGIILSLSNLLQLYGILNDHEPTATIIITLLFFTIYVIYIIITYNCFFIKQTQIGYKLLIYSLFIDLIVTSVMYSIQNLETSDFTQSFIIYFSIFGLAFILPNYIYFSKRKYIFFENNSKPEEPIIKKQETVKANSDSLNLEGFTSEQKEKINEYAELIKNQKKKKF